MAYLFVMCSVLSAKMYYILIYNLKACYLIVLLLFASNCTLKSPINPLCCNLRWMPSPCVELFMEISSCSSDPLIVVLCGGLKDILIAKCKVPLDTARKLHQQFKSSLVSISADRTPINHIQVLTNVIELFAS